MSPYWKGFMYLSESQALFWIPVLYPLQPMIHRTTGGQALVCSYWQGTFDPVLEHHACGQQCKHGFAVCHLGASTPTLALLYPQEEICRYWALVVCSVLSIPSNLPSLLREKGQEGVKAADHNVQLLGREAICLITRPAFPSHSQH